MPNTAQGNDTGVRVYTANNSILFKKTVVAVVLVFIAIVGSLLLLLRLGNLTPFLVSWIGSDKLVETRRLSLPVNLLINPTVARWRGTVLGKVISKDDAHFKIQGKGDVLNIFVEKQSLTHFFSTTLKRPMSFEEMPLGATVTGEIWYFPQAKEVIVGSLFDVDSSSSR